MSERFRYKDLTVEISTSKAGSYVQWKYDYQDKWTCENYASEMDALRRFQMIRRDNSPYGKK